MKQAEYNLSRSVLRAAASKLQKRGKVLWQRSLSNDVVAEPYALALALMAASHLYRTAASSKRSILESLFDGAEEHEPNVHTIMKCIRDLCSASVWSAHVQQVRYNVAGDEQPSANGPTELSAYWPALMDEFANRASPKVVGEAVNVLDDVFESLLSIVELLKPPKHGRPTAWDEICRHLEHVRDHFDYAEAALITVLRPGDDGDK